MSEENDVVFLDRSCASKRLFIVRDQSFLQNFVYSAGSIRPLERMLSLLHSAQVPTETGRMFECAMVQ
jgi:hypothetical protein